MSLTGRLYSLAVTGETSSVKFQISTTAVTARYRALRDATGQYRAMAIPESSPLSGHSLSDSHLGVSSLPISGFAQAESADRGGSASKPVQLAVPIFRRFARSICVLHVRALIGYSPTWADRYDETNS
jgi:hypothetical protein